MNTEQHRRVAEPAEEELKKHGDQLKTQVEEAAGKPPRESEGTNEAQTKEDRKDR